MVQEETRGENLLIFLHNCMAWGTFLASSLQSPHLSIKNKSNSRPVARSSEGHIRTCRSGDCNVASSAFAVSQPKGFRSSLVSQLPGSICLDLPAVQPMRHRQQCTSTWGWRAHAAPVCHAEKVSRVPPWRPRGLGVCGLWQHQQPCKMSASLLLSYFL